VRGPGAQAAERTNVDDSSFSGPQVRQGFARNQERAPRIGLEDGIPRDEGHLVERSAFEDGCIVDQEIEAAELPVDFGNGGAD